MERLGKPRHRREGRRLSEREVSESNLLLSLDVVSTSVDMTNQWRQARAVRAASHAGTLFRNFFSWRVLYKF
jgi:hypothetical protein